MALASKALRVVRNIQPKIKPTPHQMKALLERALHTKTHPPPPLGSPFMERAMGTSTEFANPGLRQLRGDSPREVAMGRLFERKGVPGEEVWQPREYPYEKAVEVFQGNPIKYRADPGKPPPLARAIALERGALETQGRQYFPQPPVRPDDLASKIATSRQTYFPVETSGEKRVRQILKKDVSPRLNVTEEVAPEVASEEVKLASAIEELWVSNGGGRSAIGRMWSKLKDSARGRYKPKDGKEHFVKCATSWIKDPERYRKWNEREANLLDQMMRNAKEGIE